MGISIGSFALVAAAVVLASALQASIGFGMGMLAAPVVALVDPGLLPGTLVMLAFVVTVMAELGCDVTDHRSKTFDDLEDSSFDLVISLTPQAQHRAVELARGRAADIEYWPTFDPTKPETDYVLQQALTVVRAMPMSKRAAR